MLQFADGSWALIEVKLGGEDDIRKAADMPIAVLLINPYNVSISEECTNLNMYIRV